MPRLWEGRLYSHDQHPVAQTIGRAADFGQVAYGPDLLKGYRRAATCADRVPKGAKPPDLPVEQPSKFALVINFKTAKTPSQRLGSARGKRWAFPLGHVHYWGQPRK